MLGSVLRAVRAVAFDVTPLRSSPPFRRLFLGQTVSLVGTQVTLVAVPLQVYEMTRSSLLVGLIGVAGLAPLIVFGLYGGAIADAVDRRRLVLVTSTLTMSVSVVLLVQAALGLDQVWLLFVCVAVQSAAAAVDSPTRGAIIPALVPLRQLPAANTLGFGAMQLGGVVGPLLAGVVVHTAGFAGGYAIDVVSFAGALYAAARLPHLPPGDGAQRAGLRSIMDGLRFLAGQPVVLMTFLVDLDAMLFASPRAVFPALAEDRYGPANAGLLYAAASIGAVTAVLAGGAIARVNRQGVGVIVSITLWGIAIAALGFAQSLWLAAVLLAVAGAADTVSSVYRSTMLQTATPAGMRGRLQGVFIVVVTGGPRLGDLRTGGMASAFSPTVSLVAGGVMCVVGIAVLAAIAPGFTRYDARSVTAADDGPVDDGASAVAADGGAGAS